MVRSIPFSLSFCILSDILVLIGGNYCLHLCCTVLRLGESYVWLVRGMIVERPQLKWLATWDGSDGGGIMSGVCYMALRFCWEWEMRLYAFVQLVRTVLGRFGKIYL